MQREWKGTGKIITRIKVGVKNIRLYTRARKYFDFNEHVEIWQIHCLTQLILAMNARLMLRWFVCFSISRCQNVFHKRCDLSDPWEEYTPFKFMCSLKSKSLISFTKQDGAAKKTHRCKYTMDDEKMLEEEKNKQKYYMWYNWRFF